MRRCWRRWFYRWRVYSMFISISTTSTSTNVIISSTIQRIEIQTIFLDRISKCVPKAHEKNNPQEQIPSREDRSTIAIPIPIPIRSSDCWYCCYRYRCCHCSGTSNYLSCHGSLSSISIIIVDHRLALLLAFFFQVLFIIWNRMEPVMSRLIRIDPYSIV